jgi:hypothetical protein
MAELLRAIRKVHIGTQGASDAFIEEKKEVIHCEVGVISFWGGRGS